MSDQNNPFDYSNEFFTGFYNREKEPEVSNAELALQIQALSEKIKDMEIKLSGKFGVLYVPTREEIIKITKEQLIEEYRRINNGDKNLG